MPPGLRPKRSLKPVASEVLGLEALRSLPPAERAEPREDVHLERSEWGTIGAHEPEHVAIVDRPCYAVAR